MKYTSLAYSALLFSIAAYNAGAQEYVPASAPPPAGYDATLAQSPDNDSAGYGFIEEPSSYLNDLPPVEQYGDITYTTGGIGVDENRALKMVERQYNLRILSADAAGALAGDARISIRDQQGNEVLNTVAGPLFYAQLPAGRYTLEASNEGQVRKESFSVGNGKSAHLRLLWKP